MILNVTEILASLSSMIVQKCLDADTVISYAIMFSQSKITLLRCECYVANSTVVGNQWNLSTVVTVLAGHLLTARGLGPKVAISTYVLAGHLSIAATFRGPEGMAVIDMFHCTACIYTCIASYVL